MKKLGMKIGYLLSGLIVMMGVQESFAYSAGSRYLGSAASKTASKVARPLGSSFESSLTKTPARTLTTRTGSSLGQATVNTGMAARVRAAQLQGGRTGFGTSASPFSGRGAIGQRLMSSASPYERAPGLARTSDGRLALEHHNDEVRWKMEKDVANALRFFTNEYSTEQQIQAENDLRKSIKNGLSELNPYALARFEWWLIRMIHRGDPEGTMTGQYIATPTGSAYQMLVDIVNQSKEEGYKASKAKKIESTRNAAQRVEEQQQPQVSRQAETQWYPGKPHQSFLKTWWYGTQNPPSPRSPDIHDDWQ